MVNSTGYGPRRKENGNKLSRLLFDGEEIKYNIWEIKFLGYLRTLGLKDIILGKNVNGDKTDKQMNEETYTEFIQFLDNKSLG